MSNKRIPILFLLFHFLENIMLPAMKIVYIYYFRLLFIIFRSSKSSFSMQLHRLLFGYKSTMRTCKSSFASDLLGLFNLLLFVINIEFFKRVFFLTILIAYVPYVDIDSRLLVWFKFSLSNPILVLFAMSIHIECKCKSY